MTAHTLRPCCSFETCAFHGVAYGRSLHKYTICSECNTRSLLLQLAAHVDKWIEEQVIRYDDRKWGSRVSQKLFMDKEYVVKHIRNKHKDKIDEQKQKVRACPTWVRVPCMFACAV